MNKLQYLIKLQPVILFYKILGSTTIKEGPGLGTLTLPDQAMYAKIEL
jgi:hypothetical protein